VNHSPACASYAKRIMRVSDGRLEEEDSKLRSIERWEESERKREAGPGQDQKTADGQVSTG